MKLDRTNVVTERNFELVYPRELRERFWSLVRLALTDVFGVSETPANLYQARIDDAPVGQRIIAYHEEPLKVAAELAGVAKITKDQLRLYGELAGWPEAAPSGFPDVP